MKVFSTAPFCLLPSLGRAYSTGPFQFSNGVKPQPDYIRHDIQTAEGQEPANRAAARPILSNPRSPKFQIKGEFEDSLVKKGGARFKICFRGLPLRGGLQS